MVRNLEDPSDCFVYHGHNHPVTVAKFSPSGYWVASADDTGKVKLENLLDCFLKPKFGLVVRIEAKLSDTTRSKYSFPMRSYIVWEVATGY